MLTIARLHLSNSQLGVVHWKSEFTIARTGGNTPCGQRRPSAIAGRDRLEVGLRAKNAFVAERCGCTRRKRNLYPVMEC